MEIGASSGASFSEVGGVDNSAAREAFTGENSTDNQGVIGYAKLIDKNSGYNAGIRKDDGVIAISGGIWVVSTDATRGGNLAAIYSAFHGNKVGTNISAKSCIRGSYAGADHQGIVTTTSLEIISSDVGINFGNVIATAEDYGSVDKGVGVASGQGRVDDQDIIASLGIKTCGGNASASDGNCIILIESYRLWIAAGSYR